MVEKKSGDLAIENKNKNKGDEVVGLSEERMSFSARYAHEGAKQLDSLLKSKDIEDTFSYSVWLESVGLNKTTAIKVVAAITELGWDESQKLVEQAPVRLKKDISLSLAQFIDIYAEDNGIELRIVKNKLKASKKNYGDDTLDEETRLDLLVCQTMGLNSDDFHILRTVPVNMYLASGETADYIVDVLADFLFAFDFYEVGDTIAVIASFSKRFWFRTRAKIIMDELDSKFKKMEEALEAQQIDKPKSEIDLNQAVAAEKLLNALGNDSKSTAINIGNLLILVLVDKEGDKHNRVVTLTKEQVEMIQRDQSLLRKPELLLQHLNPKLKIKQKKIKKTVT